MSARARHLLKKFGITEEQYDALHVEQQGCCRVCGKISTSFKQRLAVDHDHATGEIRGLLCTRCNRYVIGRYRRESGLELLLAAYRYLNRKAYTGWIVPPKVKRKKRGRKKKDRLRRTRISTVSGRRVRNTVG